MVGLPSSPQDLGFPKDLFAQYARPGKRVIIIRSLALVLSIIFCYFVFTSTTIPAEWKLPVKGLGSDNVTEEVRPPAGAVLEEGVEAVVTESPTLTSVMSMATSIETITSSLSTRSSASKSKPTPTSLATEKEGEEKKKAESKHWWDSIASDDKDDEHNKDNKHSESSKNDKNEFVGLDPHSGGQFNIERALKAVLDQMPDEIYTRDLLTQIIGGGEERLHEVGLRTRLFKKYFDAWEDLHLISDGKSAYVRDDVVQYLRDTEDLSAISFQSKSEIIGLYEQYRVFLAKLSLTLFPWTAPYFADHMALHAQMYNGGRGIVLSGSEHQAPYMVTAIASFRALGCDLPIEIMYLGENDLPEEYREQMEAFPGVTTRNLKQMVWDSGWNVEGFASKAFSILMSSFREVIFLDADVLFFRDPTILFEEQGYKDTGALFFRDRVVNPQYKKKFLRAILPKPVSIQAQQSRYWNGESSEMQESGAIVVDKWRHFVSMLLVARMNGPDRADKDGNKGVYSFFYGDKETFWLGFELAGDTDYHFHQGDDGAMGTVKEVQRFTETGILEEDEKPSEGPVTTVISDKDVGDIMSGKVNVADLVHDKENKHAGDDKNDQKSNKNSDIAVQGSKSDQGDKATTEDREGDNGHQSGSEKHEESSDEKTTGKSSHEDQEQNESPSSKGSPAADSASDDESPKDPKDLNEYNNGKTFDRTDSPSSSEVGNQFSKRDFASETVSAQDWNMTYLEELQNVNYTMCAPQLLHLDLSGRPLWFNGWIQEDKFQQDPRVAVSKFEFFTSERREDDPEVFGHWDLGDHNMCCLRTDRIHRFEDNEKEVLDMIVAFARENGAIQ